MIRVLSVPSGHPYVRSLAGPGYVFLPDPQPPGSPAGQWWPSPALDAGWVRDHAGDFDVMHVHFGTESRSTEELRGFCEALREVGRPLVFTAHDLDHPHLDDQSAYREQLDLLIGTADAVLTLTELAAARIRDQHGVEARVVPHPQLAPDAWFARADAVRREAGAGSRRRAGEPADAATTVDAKGPIVGLHLREMRANVRPGRWLRALAEAVGRHPGARLRLYTNESARGGAAIEAALVEVSGLGHVDVVSRPRPDDDALALELASADVSVLPYAHGTHSGWLELCWDLGTRVLAPDVGAFAGQHREPWFMRSFSPDDPAGIEAPLAELLTSSPPPASERLEARRAVARQNVVAHRETYERLVGLGASGAARPGGAVV